MPTELITPKTGINQVAGESGQPFLVLLLRQCHVSGVNIATSVDVHAEVRTCYRFIILPLHQRHIGGVDIGASIHIGRQHTGSDGNIVCVGTITDPVQCNGDPLLTGYTGQIHRHRIRASAAHTGDTSDARGDTGALCPKRSIDADSSWESEYNLSNSTIARFNARVGCD